MAVMVLVPRVAAVIPTPGRHALFLLGADYYNHNYKQLRSS